MSEQSRINSIISYCFLGPIFLLAKSGTPLAETSVQMHAKKSSQIIAITLIVFLVYTFLLKNLLNISLFGISLDTVILSMIIGGCIAFLMRGAYRAYRGESGTESPLMDSLVMVPNTHEYKIASEDEKVRTLAAMLPFLGMFLTKKYPSELMTHARVMGSFFTLLSILSLYIGGSESLIPFLIIGGYILLFVVEGVSLFIQGHFLLIAPLTRIPTYRTLEAYFFASLRSIGEFFRIVFGGTSRTTLHTLVEEELLKTEKSHTATETYFMPISSVGLPFWNLFTIPSLFIGKYREYRGLIVQGLIITLITVYILFVEKNFTSPILALLIFPVIHLFVFAGGDTHTHAPVIGTISEIFRRILSLVGRRKNTETMGAEAKFSYEVEK